MKLREYQTDISSRAATILQRHGMVYLSLEVRTGKTITSLETVRKRGFDRVLFVTKKKAIGSIEADARLFPLMTVDVINFESVSKIKGTYPIVIIDEAHSLGAYPKPAKRVNDLKPYCKGAEIIYLSGTPTPESFSQLYHQFYVSDYSPFHRYKSFYRWADTFVNKKKKYLYNREMNDYSDAKSGLIKQETEHLFLSFTQKQAGFDVSITEKVLSVEMPTATAIIKRLLKDRVVEGQSTVILADTAVKMQSKVLQLCGGTIICEDGEGYIVDRSKAEAIRRYFAGQKIAIYYKFKKELDLLKEVFADSWTDSPEAFQHSTDKTFLGQFISAREGIRLDTADAIVFYSIDFAYLSYEQARNRIVSKERVKPAVLYWVQCDGGIEEKIYQHVIRKKDYTNFYFKKDFGYVGKSCTKKDNQSPFE